MQNLNFFISLPGLVPFPLTEKLVLGRMIALAAEETAKKQLCRQFFKLSVYPNIVNTF
jgi:hypothetical protein